MDLFNLPFISFLRRSEAGAQPNAWTVIRGLVGSRAYQVRAAEDGWMVAERGSNLPIKMFGKKLDAVNAAKKMARDRRADLDIYTKQGELQTTLSFD